MTTITRGENNERIILTRINDYFDFNISIAAIINYIGNTENLNFHKALQNYFNISSFEFHRSTCIFEIRFNLDNRFFEKRYEIYENCKLFPETLFKIQFNKY